MFRCRIVFFILFVISFCEVFKVHLRVIPLQKTSATPPKKLSFATIADTCFSACKYTVQYIFIIGKYYYHYFRNRVVIIFVQNIQKFKNWLNEQNPQIAKNVKSDKLSKFPNLDLGNQWKSVWKSLTFGILCEFW